MVKKSPSPSRTPAPAPAHTRSRNARTSALRFDRASWRPPFDITSELATSRDDYSGDIPVTIYALPSYLRTSLDRVRARVVDTSKPGLSPTITACLSCGISILGAQPDIRGLLSLKEQLDLTEDVDAWLADDIAAVFGSFRLGASDRAMSGATRVNILVTERIKNAVSSLATDIGASFSSLASIATMIALHDQPAVLKERREEMETSIDAFLRRAKIRLKVLSALIEVLRDEGEV